MNRCSLCGRRMLISNGEFGLSCLKKSGDLLNLDGIKNLKGEKTLNKEVVKILNKGKLPNKQQKLLTNRYLTLKLLEQVDMSCYDDIRQAIRKDIEKINTKTTEQDLETMDTMPLKYANEILSLYLKFNLSDKVWTGEEEFELKENMLFNTILFGFSYYYNKKPYLSGMLKRIQTLCWNKGIKELYDHNLDCAAKFLKHSLQPEPQDIVINNFDIIIDKIKTDANFQERIEEIIEKYGKSKTFDTNKHNKEDDKEYKLLTYLNTDLKLSLNNTTINVIGKKTNGKWKLDITIVDVYDFTDYKELQELKDSDSFLDLIGNLANNVAMISTSCGLINQYNVTIKFSIEY